MKAVILAGGHATRLWPVTKHRAKPLLPLGNRPIIDHLVDEIEDQVDDLIISTNEKFEEDFQDYIEDFERDARVVTEEQDSEEEKPGTIGAIIKLIEKEDMEDDLLIIGGDNYFGLDFSALLGFCGEKDAPVNVVYDVENEEIASSLGIVDTDGDRIAGFEEKPEQPPSTLASTACYYFPSHRISLFHQYEEEFRDSDVPKEEYLDEPGRLIEWAHDRAEMFAFSFDGHWFDIGTRRGYLDALKAVMEENVIHGDVKNCDIGENVLILQDTELDGVKVENSVIFPNSKIRESEIRNSLIDSHSELEDADVNDAIIGKHTSM